MKYGTCLVLMFFVSSWLLGNDPGNQPIELGKVNWSRDYETSLAKAKQLNVPMLILFQEVPGCATCTRYGMQVLSHPLIVDLIHSQFIPVAIYNNKRGEDARVLKKYQEPSWNNPVVRIVDSQERDLVTRVSGNYTPLGLVQAIKRVLLIEKKAVPEYLYLLEDELTAQMKQTDEATFSMYCFWSGEKLFGGLDGVVKTRAGWAEGKEVVEVTYRPDIISTKALNRFAEQNSCHLESSPRKFENDRQPKYYLSNSLYRFLPLSELQASRINSRLGSGENAFDLLSPTQQKWYLMLQKRGIDTFENLVQVDLREAWDRFEKNI